MLNDDPTLANRWLCVTALRYSTCFSSSTGVEDGGLDILGSCEGVGGILQVVARALLCGC